MPVDYPRAWQIARSVSFEKHQEECVYRLTEGAGLCDCKIIYAHPEQRCPALHITDGETLRDRNPFMPASQGECTCRPNSQR